MDKETTKMIPGDELHLTMLMAPYSLNLVTGQDRQHLLAFGRAAFDAGKNTGHASEPVASMLTFVNGKPAKCGCRFSYSDGGGEYSDVGSVTLCAKHAGTERNGIERAEPFMWAIQEPGGGAYMDENCVSTSRETVEAEVDGLNLGLDADDEPYKVVPVYLAAAPQAVQAAALAHLDGLLDDAAAHIYPSDLRKCQTSECTVTVASVRMGIAAKGRRVEEEKDKHIHLLAARKVEAAWRNRRMVPTCPHCGEGISATDGLGGGMISKEIDNARRLNRAAQRAAKQGDTKR